ncbi:MAG: hypothetical protein HYV97_15210 [Bdellovibrio sp.]|nr:hypothetical protein [Bdellovibrio sp.]
MLLIFFAFIGYVHANCELYTQGFHTVAEHHNKDNPIFEKIKVLNYKFIDEYLLITDFTNKSSDDSESSQESALSSLDLFQKITYAAKQCTAGKPTLIEGKFKTLRFLNCLNDSPPEGGGVGILSTEKKQFIIPIKLPFFKEDDLKIVERLTKQNIKLISSQDRNISSSLTVAKSDLSYLSSEHFMIGQEGFYYSITTMMAKPKKKLALKPAYSENKDEQLSNFKFYFVTLNFNNKIWYIGDSAQSECGIYLNDSLFYPKDKAVIPSLGNPIYLKKAYDLNNDGFPDLISFGFDRILYYLEFSQRLTVLKDNEDRADMWHFNTNPKRKFKTKSK